MIFHKLEKKVNNKCFAKFIIYINFRQIAIFHIMFIKSILFSTEILDVTFPVVIVAGQSTVGSILDSVELMDNNTNCKVDPFPTRLSHAVGINGMVCGGDDYNLNILSSCWQLNPSGTWTAGENMLERRTMFTLSKVQDEIIAIGGQTTNYIGLRSVEKYSLRKDEGWSRMKDTPTTIDKHCTVMLNTSYLMAIGGSQNGQVNSNPH